jgi:hypothetical protein
MWKNILKKCSCEKDSNTEAVEKVAGAVTVASAPALFKPTFSGKKRKCKKCQK